VLQFVVHPQILVSFPVTFTALPVYIGTGGLSGILNKKTNNPEWIIGSLDKFEVILSIA
jgi:hypothetical protein